MDTTPAQNPNDTVVRISATSNSRALFIAEVLAGCAAAILLMVIICCFCSGAARRRNPRDQTSVRDLFSLRRGSEISENGRQTPDAAPAYSTTSPLGPLSPEVVEAISRASIDRRHSLVVSILSSSNSLQNQLGSATSGIQIGSGLPSMASTFIPDLPLPIGALSVRSLSTSPRSSMTAERPSRDGGDGGEEQHLTGSSSSPRPRPGRLSNGSTLPFMHHMQRDPPSYDPNWRSSLQLPTHHTYDRFHRSRHLSASRIAPLVRLDPAPHSGDEADQGVNQTLLNPSNSRIGMMERHRRTGSVNTTTPLRAETILSPPSIVFEGQEPSPDSNTHNNHNSSFHNSSHPVWSHSGRSISWTGSSLARTATTTITTTTTTTTTSPDRSTTTFSEDLEVAQEPSFFSSSSSSLLLSPSRQVPTLTLEMDESGLQIQDPTRPTLD